MLNIVYKVGKSIPQSILGRDKKWRQEVIDRQGKFLVGLADNSEVKKDCPICDNSTVFRGTVMAVRYRECSYCSHLFSELMPSKDFLANYYEQPDSAQIATYVDLEFTTLENRQSKIAKEKVAFVVGVLDKVHVPHGPEPLWVDIGCGVGDLLLESRDSGFTVVGVEPDPIQAQVASIRHIEVIRQFLTDSSDIPEVVSQARVLSLLNLVEHVAEPRQFVSNVTRALGPGAILVIEVPRYPSVSALVQFAGMRDVSRYINPLEHLNIFSDRSMELLLKEVGFSTIGKWTYGSDALETFSAVGETLGWSGGFGDPALENQINKLQSSIDKAYLSDNMIVVAAKSSGLVTEVG